MILSETNWKYKKPVSINATAPMKQQHATGAVYINRTVEKSSNFLSSALCEYKAFIIIALLLIFQFSLYDFDINEYSSIKHFHTNTQITSNDINLLTSE